MSLGIQKTFTLDMVPGGAPPIIHVSAGDVGRPYRANLNYDGETYDLEDVTSVVVRGTKPDKTVFEYALTFDTEDSHVDFVIKEQMAIIAGQVLCEIRLFSGEDTIGSANFILDVETAVFDPNAISESEVTGLNDMIQAATPEVVADWFENDAPTSETFTNAVGGAVADYVEDNGVGFTLKVRYKTGNGYIASSGGITGAGAETQEVYTNKLPCFPGDTLTMSFTWESTAGKWVAVAWFDENGKFISRSTSYYNGTGTSYTGTAAIPANAYYYSVTWRTYGNCTANFSYNGSVYDIRNRVDKGLSRETIAGGFDTTVINSPISAAFAGAVQLFGNSPITDFVRIEPGCFLDMHLDTANLSTYYMALYFDGNKNFISNTTWYQNAETRTTPPNGAKYVRFTFASGAVIGSIEQYFTYKFPEIGGVDALTPIICGAQYPALDTANGTFTIPYDCIYFKNGKEYRPSALMSATGATVLNVPANSSAQRLFFDLQTNSYTWLPYSTIQTDFDRYILVAVLRYNTSSSFYSVAITCPYQIDGKLYGIDTTAEVDLDAVAWAFNENVKGVNHRGYNTAPENTLPAYKLSKQNGFSYVETDVSYTSDGVAVLLHDGTINRTARNADGTEISGDVAINSITYEQALTYDFGIYKGSQYAGTQIPTFEQFIKLCKNLGLHPYIELKTGTEAQTQGLIDTVKACGMRGRVTWISFSDTRLTWVKNYDAAARIGYVVNDIDSTTITTAQGLKTTANEVFIDSSWTVTDAKIELCTTAGIPLEVWTVDSSSSIEGLNPYISGVTSDNLIAAKVLYEANI